MSRKRVRRKGGYERFIALPHFMLRCPAWLTMSSNAKALLIDVWSRHNGVNNGEISYSVREAAAIGLGRSAAARAFNELLARGFLQVSRNSSFTYKMKKARTWILTAERVNEQPSTRDFMRWSAASSEPAKNIQSHRKDRQSHPWDRDQVDATMLPTLVTSAGPSAAVEVPQQSCWRDTYIIPGAGE